MRAGNFNIEDYLTQLNEAAETANKSATEGQIIPDTNRKTFDWLKSEFNKGKTEAKVEIKQSANMFKVGYDLQTNLNSVKDFKPGLYGQVKTSETKSTPEAKPKTLPKTSTKKKEDISETDESAESSKKETTPKKVEKKETTETETKPKSEKKEVNIKKAEATTKK